MFNEELKTRFIRESTESIKTAQAYSLLFNAIQRTEEEHSADICTYDTPLLREVIKNLPGVRTNGRNARLSMLKQYCKWCLKEGYPGARDIIGEMTIEGAGRLKQQTVASPTHLEKFLNEVFMLPEKNTVDNTYRCYLWLAYSGLKAEDAIKITKEDIKFNKMVIEYDGAEYPIYREALPCINKCIELSQFDYIHPGYNHVVKKDRALGRSIVRGTGGEPTVEQFRMLISRANKKKLEAGKTGISISYFRAWLSGVFYRIYEKESIGIETDFVELAQQIKAGREYKLDTGGNTVAAKHRQLAKDYKEDYYMWKLVHNK